MSPPSADDTDPNQAPTPEGGLSDAGFAAQKQAPTPLEEEEAPPDAGEARPKQEREELPDAGNDEPRVRGRPGPPASRRTEVDGVPSGSTDGDGARQRMLSQGSANLPMAGPQQSVAGRTSASSEGTRAPSMREHAVYDYFLSHKKTHSKLGGLPEQMAKNIHDALAILGAKGFFDVDDLDEISRENIAEMVRQSKTMIVFMNDETLDSEWCRLEWQTAHDNNIPIKVVVDIQNFIKKSILKKFDAGDFQFLLQYQWVDYSDSTRRQAIQNVSQWVTQEKNKLLQQVESNAGSNGGGVMGYTPGGALCIQIGDRTLQIFHPFFEFYMVFCGLVYNQKAWGPKVILWTKFVRMQSVGCFCICLWRLIYGEGPAFTDWYSCLYVVIIHVFLFHGLVYMTGLLSGDTMKMLLRTIANSSRNVSTAKKTNLVSLVAAVVGLSCGVATAASMIVVYLPLFLDSYYLDNDLAHGQAFGALSAVFFISVAPIVLIQEFAVLTLLLITTFVIQDIFEASVCRLCPLIAKHGLREFLATHHEVEVSPTDEDLKAFGESWSEACILFHRLRRYLNPVVYMHLIFNLEGVMIPVVYYFLGDELMEGFLERGQPWHKWAKPVIWWGFATVCYLATVAIPTATCSQLNAVARSARFLKMAPSENMYLLVRCQRDISWDLPPIQVSSLTAVALLLPVLLSAGCWAAICAEIL